MSVQGAWVLVSFNRQRKYYRGMKDFEFIINIVSIIKITARKYNCLTNEQCSVSIMLNVEMCLTVMM